MIATTAGDRATREVNVSEPSIARVCDYLLAGKDNFFPDRDAADAMLKVQRNLSAMVRATRPFAQRTVEYLIGEQGVSQLLDVLAAGAEHGLPPLRLRSRADLAA